MSEKLHISSSPHIHTSTTVQLIMLDVIIALLPAAFAGIYYFGLKALIIILTSIISCVLCEFLFNIIVKKEQSIGDLSAIVTGLLLGMSVSAAIPIWQVVVGSVFAIIIVKCFFGGMGCNVVNPAIAARVFMLLAFGGSMAKVAIPAVVDAASGATPLVQIAEGNVPKLMDLFLGRCGGAIGETCSLALLIGGIYLVIKRVITVHIPLAYIGTVFVMSYFITGMNIYTATAYILSGSLFIGAIFMATDYVTSPATPMGKIVFGVIAGVFTVFIRFWSVYPESVSFAILLVNILNPYIDIWTARRVFGGKKV